MQKTQIYLSYRVFSVNFVWLPFSLLLHFPHFCHCLLGECFAFIGWLWKPELFLLRLSGRRVFQELVDSEVGSWFSLRGRYIARHGFSAWLCLCKPSCTGENNQMELSKKGKFQETFQLFSQLTARSGMCSSPPC